MKVKNHIVSSGIISSLIYLITNSPLNATASFLAGVLIDLDHLFDYYMNFGATYKIREIYNAISEIRLSKIYLLLHSIELLLVFWALIFLIPLKSIYFAIAIGMTQHIFFDILYNPLTPRAYFLSYRMTNKFRKEDIIDFSRLSGKSYL